VLDSLTEIEGGDGGELTFAERVGHDPDLDPVTGFVEVRLADWIGWREVGIPADLARSMSEGVRDYMRGLVEGDSP
jgi:hypothetical protein